MAYDNNKRLTGQPMEYLGSVLVFSFVINMLMLVGPIYMMQVYDRVLSSSSVPTLVGISLIAGLLYIFMGTMDYLRSQLLTSKGEAFANDLAMKAFDNSLEGFALENPTSDRRNAIEDVAMVRSFLVSSGFTAMIDALWMPIFLLFIFILHPILGITAIIATILLTVLALANERTNREGVKRDSALKQATARWASQVQRQAPSIMANGMDDAMARRWFDQEQEARQSALKLSSKTSGFSTVTKTTRMMIQSGILGLGALLAIQGHMTPGAMIAASIVFSRTLAPIEQILGQFTQILRARESWRRIKTWNIANNAPSKMDLPAPSQSLTVKIASLTPPDGPIPVLQGVQFALKAGDVLGVIGESGGGKSSLAKALAGAWVPQGGAIELDGSGYRDWPRKQLGKAIGYMSQESQLFDGTIAENISGFMQGAESEAIIAACQLAGAHDMITAMPKGYNTPVGPSGMPLSAGQRQRVTLSRALFGNPFIIVLDEPNSNLDEKGENALAQAIKTLSDKGKIVIVVAHRQRVLREVSHICVIEAGGMKMWGPREAIQKRLSAAANPEQTQMSAMAATQLNTKRKPPARESKPQGRTFDELPTQAQRSIAAAKRQKLAQRAAANAAPRTAQRPIVMPSNSQASLTVSGQQAPMKTAYTRPQAHTPKSSSVPAPAYAYATPPTRDMPTIGDAVSTGTFERNNRGRP